jgi:hypothetical protein
MMNITVRCPNALRSYSDEPFRKGDEPPYTEISRTCNYF